MSNNSKNVKGYYRPEIINKFAAALKVEIANVKAGSLKTVSFSGGNSKMGAVTSVSTLPFITCPEICNGTCGRVCYAAKIANLYKNVRESYARNAAIAFYNRPEYFRQINEYCAGVRFFRWHVSGDIIDTDYFENMVAIARNNPHCEFLVFTKRYIAVNQFVRNNGGSIAEAIPGNMHVLFSDCAGLNVLNPFGFATTMIIEEENQFDENTMKYCGGNCFNCACRGVGCWQASAGDTIAFKKH